MTYPEGDILPFRMTPEQRQAAVEKSVSRSPEYDGVKLFRAKLEPRPPRPKAPPPGKRFYTKVCSCCRSKVRVKLPRIRRKAAPPQKRWWLYYGPGRMTGGFRTKQEAKNWFLNGGR